MWFTRTHAVLVVSETVKEDRVDEVKERELDAKSVEETAWCLGA